MLQYSVNVKTVGERPCYSYFSSKRFSIGLCGEDTKNCKLIKMNYLLTYFVALVRKRTIPTERPPLVCAVSANFC
jgi:hypothetical protein